MFAETDAQRFKTKDLNQDGFLHFMEYLQFMYNITKAGYIQLQESKDKQDQSLAKVVLPFWIILFPSLSFLFLEMGNLVSTFTVLFSGANLLLLKIILYIYIYIYIFII